MTKTFQIIFIACVIVGYFVGAGWGIATRSSRTEFVENCLEYDRVDYYNAICTEYGPDKLVTERLYNSLIFYGFAGAFVGGWIGVFISILEKPNRKRE